MNTVQEGQTTTPEPEEPPVSYDEAKLERSSFWTTVGLGEPIKKKTRQMSREYMREYYHKNKAEIVCCFCFKTYTCKSSLVKHQGRSFKCAIERINKTFSDFTEEGVRIRNNVRQKQIEDGLKILQRLANKIKNLNKKRLKWLT